MHQTANLPGRAYERPHTGRAQVEPSKTRVPSAPREVGTIEVPSASLGKEHPLPEQGLEEAGVILAKHSAHEQLPRAQHRVDERDHCESGGTAEPTHQRVVRI